MYKDINLLYSEEQKRKGIGPQLTYLILVLVIVSLIFAGIYGYTYFINNEAADYEAKIESTQEQIDELSNKSESQISIINKTNNALSFIIDSETHEELNMYDFILILSGIMPEDTYLNDISYDKKSNIFFEGISKNPRDVAEFSNKLKNIDLIYDTNIRNLNTENELCRFSMEVTIREGE